MPCVRVGVNRKTPSRDARAQPVTAKWGGAVAARAWLLGSAAFSSYVSRAGGYDRVYGSPGAVVGLMTWAWLSSAAVLAGAALNAELEREAAP